MTRAALCLLFACCAALSQAESLESRLLRTIQSGAPQALSVDDAVRSTRDPSRFGYLGFALASGALYAIGEHRLPKEWPAPRILEKTLGELHEGLSFDIPPDFPARFGSEDLVFTLVYAIAVGGSTGRATDILERNLEGAPDYKRAVILQALRNLGTRRASNLIQREAARGGDRNLAENLLADRHYPFLDELRGRLRLIPPAQRNRGDLMRIAGGGCTVKSSVAAYLLGFQGPAGDAAQERAELELLRRLSTLECFWTRFLAIRSLALRSGESIEFWESLYRTEKDAWQKAQLARIGFGRFGTGFAPSALAWLSTEPSQYVQWELMHGYLESATGATLRDYWDIWQPAALQFRLNFPPRRNTADARPDLNGALSWLEAGSRPLNDVVRNHFVYGLAKSTQGDETRRLLKALSVIPERSAMWWVLQPLQDKSALPLLRYWENAETDSARRKEARNVLLALESRDGSAAGRSGPACCQPTRACLVMQMRLAGNAEDGEEITSPGEAREWLERQVSAPAEPEIRFLDVLERIAEVKTARAPVQRWEHIYGCWHPIRPLIGG